ncbi:MAG: hypothetical protein JSV91_08120 [Phycisphaerales bacterium]|nr:MAG: hypothetical protein JSV91_08120 [Phycisphaerales bacterium]
MGSQQFSRKRYLPWVAGLIAVTAGYLAGSGTGVSNAAFADGDPAKVTRMLRDKELVPVAVQPPAIALTHGGIALVGAADDRYYIIQADGTALMVECDRRRALFWR